MFKDLKIRRSEGFRGLKLRGFDGKRCGFCGVERLSFRFI